MISLRPLSNYSPAQTDIKDPSAEPSADDFLAREKAILGDDAELFTTSNDTAAFAGSADDLIGGGNAQTTFEAQFPDLAQPAQVRYAFSRELPRC